MTEPYAPFGEALAWLVALVLSSVRVLVVSLFLPMLKPTVIMRTTYLGVVLAIASLNVPVVMSGLPDRWPWSFWFPVVAKEAFIGMVVGFVAGAVFWAVDAAGALIDQQTGSTQSSVLDPLNDHSGGPSDDFMTQAFTTLVLASGAFLVLLGGLYDTFALWPVLSTWPALTEGFVSGLADEFSRQFALGGALVLPFLVVLLLVEVAVGLAARAMPSLDGHTFAQGLKHLAAQFLMLILLGALFARILEYIAAFPVREGVKRILGV
ncbi:MAG: hypothetical protein RJA99_3911 [Pseudomonadota bacterium]